MSPLSRIAVKQGKDIFGSYALVAQTMGNPCGAVTLDEGASALGQVSVGAAAPHSEI